MIAARPSADRPQTGKCRCGRRILNAGSGWYHEPGQNPPIGHYAQPSVVA